MHKTITQSGVGVTDWIPMDRFQAPFAVGLGAVVTGTATYTVQHTFDDLYDTSITPTAFDHSSLAGDTANGDGNYAFPISGIRLNVTAGTGSVALTIIQGSR